MTLPINLNTSQYDLNCQNYINSFKKGLKPLARLLLYFNVPHIKGHALRDIDRESASQYRSAKNDLLKVLIRCASPDFRTVKHSPQSLSRYLNHKVTALFQAFSTRSILIHNERNNPELRKAMCSDLLASIETFNKKSPTDLQITPSLSQHVGERIAIASQKIMTNAALIDEAHDSELNLNTRAQRRRKLRHPPAPPTPYTPVVHENYDPTKRNVSLIEKLFSHY